MPPWNVDGLDWQEVNLLVERSLGDPGIAVVVCEVCRKGLAAAE